MLAYRNIKNNYDFIHNTYMYNIMLNKCCRKNGAKVT